MTDDTLLIETLESRSRRRIERREFFRTAGVAAILAGTAAATMSGTPAIAQDAPSDADILNFALNLEYLEAQFYSYAAFGEGLDPGILGGTGTQGAVIPGRAVSFTDPVVREYAREIARDEIDHVVFLRTQLGEAAVAQPAIDVGFGPANAFSLAAQAAGLVGPGEAFDPYLNDENFLLGAFIFEDVGVTAYKGAAPLITSPVFLEAAAGLLAVEAYHAGLVRTVLYAKGMELRDATDAISDARDSLDGPEDKDQGTGNILDASNIVPLDENGLAFSRTTGEVLNIVFLNSDAVTQGGFFPAGVNGAITMSDPNTAEG